MKRMCLVFTLALLALAGTAQAQDLVGPTGGACLLTVSDLPVYVAESDGTLTLTDWGPYDPHLGLELKTLLAVKQPCNGGSKKCDGTVLTCPGTGGPICTSKERCKCLCDSSDGSVYNGCTKIPKGAGTSSTGD